MISQTEFLKKYNIERAAFTEAKLSWADLESIYSDYEPQRNDFVATGNLVSEHLRQIPEVHSLKMRVKEPEHLIEKIIRKRIEEPGRDITLENYAIQLTDLVGVRALHLFKEDWIKIHKAITEIWDNDQQPVANIRRGDPEALFVDYGCRIVEHEAGYRSVHYIVRSQPTKKVSIVEIQVRTIFEEGWSEIDHRLRYPYEVENPILCDYLGILNRFAGAADEMGSFIRRLNSELKEKEAAYRTEIENYECGKREMIENLESVKKKLNAESKEREKLQNTIDSLQSAKPPQPVSDPGGYGFSGFSGSRRCESCGHLYSSMIGVCPNCSLTGNIMPFGRKCKSCGGDLGFGVTSSASQLCFRCEALTPLMPFEASRTCSQCLKSFKAGPANMITDNICPSCKGTKWP